MNEFLVFTREQTLYRSKQCPPPYTQTSLLNKSYKKKTFQGCRFLLFLPSGFWQFNNNNKWFGRPRWLAQDVVQNKITFSFRLLQKSTIKYIFWPWTVLLTATLSGGKGRKFILKMPPFHWSCVYIVSTTCLKYVWILIDIYITAMIRREFSVCIASDYKLNSG